MNILLVTPWRPSTTGGISTVIASLGTEFEKLGHRVAVFVTDENNVVRQIESLQTIPVYGMYLRCPISREFPLLGFAKWLFAFPFTIWQLVRLVTQLQTDAIIVQYPLPNMFYFGLLTRLSGVRLVVTYNGNDAHDLGEWHRWERALVGFLLREADIVFGVSRTLLAKVQQAFPWFQTKRQSLMPNGAPLALIERVQPTQTEKLGHQEFALTAGHLIRRKGIDVIISALKLAKDAGVRVQMMIAGDGPEREALIWQAQELDVAGQIKFLGNRSQEEVLSLMKASAFFVLASRAEGMPLVVAEAMACGTAVVATEVDGIPDMVQQGSTGLLVPSEDPQALARAMVDLATQPSHRQELAARGKDWALKQYNWTVIAQRYLEHLRA
ncbi:MAG: glycosyltransferase family 4 protein [Nitrospiraceae bacterium]|nr:glycosyltransferase family 4 protein [Nitrospiraceae bacterium]